MLPSLIGIIASSGGAAADLTDYVSIATVTVGSGGASTVTFSSIPNTYQHLQIRGIMRSSVASVDDDPVYRFNSDTGANYARHLLYGDGSIAGAGSSVSASSIAAGQGSGASTAANIFGAHVVDILDYSSTTKNKTVRTLAGCDQNGYGYMVMRSGLWLNTSAISSITIITGSGSNFAQYSTFALYGIKG